MHVHTLTYSTIASHLGGYDMLRTIRLGSCVSVQGIFVRLLPDGRMQVRVGDQLFAGQPVEAKAA